MQVPVGQPGSSSTAEARKIMNRAGRAKRHLTPSKLEEQAAGRPLVAYSPDEIAVSDGVSDSLHRLERSHHPCSRSEYSSTYSSRSYNAEAPDAHPICLAQNPSTGCRDPDLTPTIHPPCAAKRPYPQSDTCLDYRDHCASNRPACAENLTRLLPQGTAPRDTPQETFKGPSRDPTVLVQC